MTDIRTTLVIAILGFLASACSMMPGEQHAYSNHLVGESSPYLLQHAHNPVDWHPWGEEALEKAQRENKLIVISVGYAACHWCHVMEHESFEDTTIARIMNEHFVSIKVDREERPDVDDIYMTACQLASDKGCGWPLNAFALPNGQPVWAGTYFPKKQWREILEYFANEYSTNPEQMQAYAEQLTEGIANAGLTPVDTPAEFAAPGLALFAQNLLGTLDMQTGGRKGAPKFPMPDNFAFLMAYHHYSQDPLAMEAVKVTIDHLARGGIYDHLGGGFSRYSTDTEWLVPHFEKMLYDNGQLVSLYAQAFAATGDSSYLQIVEESLAFVARDLTDKNGGFYSSLDADSEGEEGKYYVWEQSEIDSLLLPEEAQLVTAYYNLLPRGNWEHGKNILHVTDSLEAVADELGLAITDASALLSSAREKLLEARRERPRPGLDDKVLTAWNALMLRGYADAYAATSNEEYLVTALKNANFLLDEMMSSDGRLNRNFKGGKSSINAFLDDYALLAQAFTRLYEVTFDESWLDHTEQLLEYALDHFQHESNSLLYYTSDIDPPLVARRLEVEDDVIASSNSLFAEALFLTGTYLYREDFIERSRSMLSAISERIATSQAPSFYTNWAQLYLQFVRPPYEIAIVGPDWQSLQVDLQQNYLPNALLLGGENEGQLALLQNKSVEGETYIYVCQNKVCKLPVQTVVDALPLMQ